MLRQPPIDCAANRAYLNGFRVRCTTGIMGHFQLKALDTAAAQVGPVEAGHVHVGDGINCILT